jgi:phosphatidate cytidylyltransferase
MKKFVKRLLLFFLAIPAIIAVILLLPQWGYLCINIIIIVTSVFCTLEVGKLFFPESALPLRIFAAAANGFLGIIVYLETLSVISGGIDIFFFVGCCMLVMFIALQRKDRKNFSAVLPRAGGGVFLLVYPGLLLTYLIRVSGMPNPAFMLLFLLLTVFLSDVAAYLFGMLFGKRKDPITNLSPKKSVVGFISGFVTSIALTVGAKLMFPPLFSLDLVRAFVLGILLGFFIITGDLFESALKRSAGVKDSGKAIPGRGGILDSIDSLLFAAPVFYYFCRFALTS